METDKGDNNNAAEIRDAVLELNFVPDWARKPPSEVHFTERPAKRQPKRHYHDRRREGDRKGRPPRRREQAPPRMRKVSSVPDAARKPHVEMPAVEVRFLPERKRLNAVIQQVKISNRAYPLRDIADLFLTKPNSCDVRFECKSDDKSQKLFQCSICKTAALGRERIIDHLISAHVEDFFDIEEREVDGPAGEFVCVARCGLSGMILGPPNHHSYSAKIQEVHKTKFSYMTLNEYKERIETSKDEELIVKWKEDQSRQIFYSLKKDPSGEKADMDWHGVESYITNNVASKNITACRTVIMPLAIARKVEDEGLVMVAREAWKKENRFPVSLAIALRGAFRSRKLMLFRVGKDAVFVSAISPVPLDRKHVVSDILDVLTFLDDHPGCTRAELLKGLHPELTAGSPEAIKALAPLSWLIEKGHIIEFYNGTLSVPKSRN